MIFTFLALIIIFLILFLIIKKYKETFVIEKDIGMEDDEQISTKFNELIGYCCAWHCCRYGAANRGQQSLSCPRFESDGQATE